jgi:phosphoribosylformimino-5-aminoimidazole carboxamide ribotide isomerase
VLIIPAIDLKNGKCVRLLQGRRDAPTVYDDDPVEVAKSFALAGASMLHVVDLDGAFSDRNSPNRRLLADVLGAIEIPLQFGGGLRSPAEVEEVIELGVARAIVGTLAVESPDHLPELVRTFGKDRIAVGIDAKDGEVMVRGWEQKGKTRAIDLARVVAKAGIERIIYTDVARDGMLNGPNLEQTLLLARETGLKVTASGGVSSLDDLKRLNELSGFGIDSVIVGKALYERRFNLAEAIRAVS